MPRPKVQPRSKTSWRAKLHKPMLPLVPVPDGVMRRLGQGVMLIPTLLEVDTTIRKIPRVEVNALGKVVREKTLRQRRDSAGGLFI